MASWHCVFWVYWLNRSFLLILIFFFFFLGFFFFFFFFCCFFCCFFCFFFFFFFWGGRNLSQWFDPLGTAVEFWCRKEVKCFSPTHTSFDCWLFWLFNLRQSTGASIRNCCGYWCSFRCLVWAKPIVRVRLWVRSFSQKGWISAMVMPRVEFWWRPKAEFLCWTSPGLHWIKGSRPNQYFYENCTSVSLLAFTIPVVSMFRPELDRIWFWFFHVYSLIICWWSTEPAWEGPGCKAFFLVCLCTGIRFESFSVELFLSPAGWGMEPRGDAWSVNDLLGLQRSTHDLIFILSPRLIPSCARAASPQP